MQTKHDHPEIFTVSYLRGHVKECDDIPWLRKQLLVRLKENERLIESSFSRATIQKLYDRSALAGMPSHGSEALHNLLRPLLLNDIDTRGLEPTLESAKYRYHNDPLFHAQVYMLRLDAQEKLLKKKG